MPFTSGSTDVGEDATPICGLPENGVTLKNRGGTAVYLGGPDVSTDGDNSGFPLDPGESQWIPGARIKESPIVPAPPGDLTPPPLYGRTGAGTGIARVAYIYAIIPGGM